MAVVKFVAALILSLLAISTLGSIISSNNEQKQAHAGFLFLAARLKMRDPFAEHWKKSNSHKKRSCSELSIGRCTWKHAHRNPTKHLQSISGTKPESDSVAVFLLFGVGEIGESEGAVGVDQERGSDFGVEIENRRYAILQIPTECSGRRRLRWTRFMEWLLGEGR